MNIPALFCIDSYKLGHADQYPEGITKVYSNFTPRSAKHFLSQGFERDDIVFFGLQALLTDMQDSFNEFFNSPKEQVLNDFKETVLPFVGPNGINMQRFEALHDLGYLPICVKALPEGSYVPVGVPVLTITNTHDDFFWIVNYLETWISCELWKMCTSATIADSYKQILLKYNKETCDNPDFTPFQIHDFSVRGMSGINDAAKTGMGHLLSSLGSDNIPAVIAAQHYYNAEGMIACSVPACYDDQTEVLTENGFKLFRDVDYNEKVAQYHEDGSIDFVIPNDTFADYYNGNLISFTKDGLHYYDCVVTPNHRMVRKNIKSGKVEFFEAGSEKSYTSNFGQIVAGYAIGSKKSLTPLEKLRIAFQADGSFSSRKEAYNGSRAGTIPIRFNLKKDRKAARLREICNEGSFNMTESKYKNGYYSFRIALPEEMCKDFSWVNLSEVSCEWAREFIEELTHWDGCTRINTKHYTNTNLECVRIAQAIGAIAGYKTQFSSYKDKKRENRKEIYEVSFTTNKDFVHGLKVKKALIPYDGMVYCVSVPTKMLVVRRNGVVSICGNTEHSVMCAGGKESEIETFKRLLRTYPSGVVSIVSDTWDYFNVISNIAAELKEEILNRQPDSLGIAKVVFRPDSGDPQKIICGYRIVDEEILDRDLSNIDMYDVVKSEGKYYFIDPIYEIDYDNYKYCVGYDMAVEFSEAEAIGSVRVLDKIFGSTINSKGYKTLNPRVGLIYGDSITLERCKDILQNLKELGYSSDNIVFGVGSYTYNYQTRDTFGFAMKATYVEINGKGQEIFKDPKTDNGTKKSAKGLLRVSYDYDKYVLHDQQTPIQEKCGYLSAVFFNGELYTENFSTIEERLNRFFITK